MNDGHFVYEEVDKLYFKDEPECDDIPEDSIICEAQEEKSVSDGTRSKCGDVFVGSQGNFTLVCSICGEEFKSLDSFGLHINGCHLWIKSEPEVAMEYTLTESLPAWDATNISLPLNRENTISENAAQAQLKQEINTLQITINNSLPPNQHEENNEVKQINDIWKSGEELDEKSSGGGGTSDEADRKNRRKRKEYLCIRCCRTYVTKKCLDAHNKRKHKNVDVAEVSRYVEATEKPIDPTKVVCKYCDKSFDDQTELTKHMSTHTGRNRFECPLCPKKFLARTNRDFHINTHTGKRPFKCTICPKAFAEKSHLATHIRIHLGIKRFSCDYCDKRFVQGAEKKLHERTHTGERPFKCDECGRQFKDQAKLLQHTRRHKGIRNYKCEDCSKLFYSSSSLQYHKLTHTGEKPHQCDECGMRFLVLSQLKQHSTRHLGIRNFKCELCSKAFYSSYDLKNHTRIHTGERPYKCNICSEAFPRVQSLRVHQKLHPN